MKCQLGILWLRNDLRLHDHEALFHAMESAEQVLPVYCIDPRMFAQRSLGFAKTGDFRSNFLWESLRVLRKRFQEKGSNLIVRHGKPEEVLLELAKEYGADGVFAHKEVTHEERKVELAVEAALFSQGIALEFYWTSTLYHLEDLPMPINSLPEIFTQFRKQVEKYVPVRELFPTPEHIPTPKIAVAGEIPTENISIDKRAAIQFQGGEIAALERLQDYFWEKNCLWQYKETRNGLVGADYSSKFSAWLALGCISPRKIHQEVKRYEEMRKKNRSTYWMIFELIWRDYFRFIARKHGNSIFFEHGLRGMPADKVKRVSEHKAKKRFDAWMAGETGIPFVDANMRELKLTGFMSNRGRQNVASFLVRDLGVDWRWGAEYFESVLIDYDPCSNWGNWNYVAGVGNDPRENRYFNVIGQGKRYDPEAEFLRLWLPEIADLPNTQIHEPWTSMEQLDYPRPILPSSSRLVAG
ncbi:MAG: DASH family cryptochrome [Bacteroidota bacterium]